MTDVINTHARPALTLSRRLVRLAAALSVVIGPAVAQAAAPNVTNINPPTAIIQQVPQSSITLTGSNFVVGVPSQTNRPTVTLTHTSLPGVEYSMPGNVNFAGTTITLAAGTNSFNLLNAPLGTYNVKVQRPDGQSVIIPNGFSVSTEPEPAPGEIKLDIASYWGGPINSVDVDGDYAYLANGRRLVILNVANKNNPVEIGSIYLTGANDVKVRNGYAFVAAQSPHRFCVVDVHNPAAPVIVWAAPQVGSSNGEQIELYGDYAYVKSNFNISVFNIADPRNTTIVNSAMVGSRVDTFTIVGNRLLTGSYYAGHLLNIYDLTTNPVTPPLIGGVPASNVVGGSTWFVRSIAAVGNITYIATSDNALFIVSLVNPTNPVIQNILPLNGGRWDLQIAGGMLWLAEGPIDPSSRWDSHRGLVAFDLESLGPLEPRIADSFKTYGGTANVTVKNGFAYVSDLAEGLVILDVSGTTMQRRGVYHSPAVLRKMAKAGDLLYVTDAYGGFTTLNVANSAHPHVAGRYRANRINNLGVNAWGIALRGNYAYLSAGHLGIEVVDISNPAAPTFVGARRIPGDLLPASTYWDLALDDQNVLWAVIEERIPGGDFVFVVHALTGVDVSDPVSPHEFSRLEGVADTAAPVRTLLIENNRIYTSGSDRIADISNAENPTTLYAPPIGQSEFGRVFQSSDIDVQSGTIFAAQVRESAEGSQPGLYMIDTTIPANPVTIGHLNSSVTVPGLSTPYRYGCAIAVQNQHLYAAGGGPNGLVSLFLFDVKSPSAPIGLDLHTRIGQQFDTDILPAEPSVFVADIDWGLVLVDVHGITTVPPHCAGDANNDGGVNAADLSVLLGQFGQMVSASTGADFNADGVVNAADLSVLLAAFGSNCP